ncbi:ATP-binding protein [Lentzea sp. NPDC054927]
MTRTVHTGQFRLARLQVVNWGTFCGYKDFPIDERGVLLTGPSGSGKSSLMDAHSLALLPNHDQRFNASADLTARGAKQNSRSAAAYVRGAWSETNDEHEQSKVRYLRGGKPTWSAVGVTYEDGLGSSTTAVVVKWFTSAENDGSAMNTMHQLHDGTFDLQALNEWAEREFDTRWFKRMHPDVRFPSSQDAYLKELGRRIGLDHTGTALSLLGKAKAMKNVGDLNLFIRENMLDKPESFAAAARMLQTFTPLNEAYITAKRASRQEEVLRDVPPNWNDHQESKQDHSTAEGLRGTPLERYVRGLHLAVLTTELNTLRESADLLEAQLLDQTKLKDDAQGLLIRLTGQLQQQNSGLQLLEVQRQQFEAAAKAAKEGLDRYGGYVGRLGEPVPQDDAAFRALLVRLPVLLESAREQKAELEPQAHREISRKVQAQQEYTDRDAELRRLRSAPTLIPGHAIARRETIVRGTGVPINTLPYAAELIDIAEGEECWRPVAEKVLRNYGMRLLVATEHIDRVRRFVDSHNMRGLVEYTEVTAVSAHMPQPARNRLAGKLTVDQQHPHGRWLAAQLARQFDHVCVETAAELDGHRFAVTLNGTVKMPGNHYRKDDRPELTNPSNYILGANTAAKRQALEREVAALADEVRSASESADGFGERLEVANKRIDAATELMDFTTWSSVDYWAPTRAANGLGEQIAQIRANDVDLQRLETQRNKAQEEFEKAIGDWQKTKQRIDDEADEQIKLGDLRHAEEAKPHTVDEDERLYLDEVYTAIQTTATTSNISAIRRSMGRELDNRVTKATSRQALAAERIRSAITLFLEHWRDYAPDDSGDVNLSGASFAALHTEIVTRRLPEAMGKLQHMISNDMVPSIAMLQHTIDEAGRQIEERVGWVNAGLRRVEFNDGTHLQIAYAANPSADVKAFRDAVDELMRKAAVLKNDPEQQVAQFHRVKALMKQFTDQDTAAERWRRNVLDVRNSYTFYGRELDEGGITVYTYRNTATNSGGEQEKLVAFCLAAALSYNLADPDTDGRPRFGTLMLDEAFSKSDENFSAQALSAFDEFGFQLMIAAPIRMAGIVEPYIGQAILVDKRVTADGARSTGKTATFGELAARRFADEDGEIRATA